MPSSSDVNCVVSEAVPGLTIQADPSHGTAGASGSSGWAARMRTQRHRSVTLAWAVVLLNVGPVILSFLGVKVRLYLEIFLKV